MTTAAPTKIPAAPTWDLDSIFPGGSKSEEYKKFREQTKAKLDGVKILAESLPSTITKEALRAWVEFVERLQECQLDISLVLSFASCLGSQNVDDSLADSIYSEGLEYYSEWEKLKADLESLAIKQSDEDWDLLTSDPKMNEVKFYIDELRDLARSKMPIDQEKLALDLSVNGYHSWYQLYEKMSGELRVEYQENGKSETLSLGQLATKFSSPDRAVRKQAFEKMTAAWQSRTSLASMALNNMSGFRLSLYKNRNWKSYMYEPLLHTRMQEKTLDTMWSVIEKNISRLQPYIDAKKKLLNIDKFSWYDEFAPCGKADKLILYAEAADFIVEKTRTFSDDLANFCRMAIDKRWVEAEDRAGKRGGGFCTDLGARKQSRIFMTYAGSYENLLTLAHELGHAYHGYVLKDRPPFAQEYPMNLAETASIFTESLVTEAALSAATDSQEKLMLLDQKLQSAYIFFCNVYSRYLFDRSFYEERAKGMVEADRLSELMVAAQKRAYGNLLDESGYHPLFWCSKLHFYISDTPFYNFPYTFGFLFATGVYQQSKKEGAGFADKYRALLADTGSMTTEAVAQKHMDVDLTQDNFWQAAVDNAFSDIDEFVNLASTM